MNKFLLSLVVIILTYLSSYSQCNPDLNLGAVLVPTHANSSNNGNIFNVNAWMESANWIDSLNLDFRQKYINWKDVVGQINNGVPTYNNYFNFENQLSAWAGNAKVHLVYPVIKVEQANTLLPAPTGFISGVVESSVDYFSDTAFVNQNYNAIKHILENVNNVEWISVGNEIDTYFKNSYWGTGRLNRFTSFIDTLRIRMDRDGFSQVKLGSIVTFHNLTWSGSYAIIDSIRPHLDYLGLTCYFTTQGSPNDNCWGTPSDVLGWLNTAKTLAADKPIFISETAMGEGGGTQENCGSPEKQLAYADTLLKWYEREKNSVEGICWFTLADPFLGWQTPSTLWNTVGLVDSNGISIQPAGTLWRHECNVTSVSQNLAQELLIYPNPASALITMSNLSGTPSNIKIYDVLGKLVFEKSINENRTNIDVSSWKKGVYNVVVLQKNETQSQNIVIR